MGSPKINLVGVLFAAVGALLWLGSVAFTNSGTGLVATIGMVGPQIDGVAQQETLPTYPQLRLRINIPATQLEVYKDEEFITSYSISVGALAYKSPVMKNELTTLVWNPDWTPPDSPWAVNEKYTPPGPKNPLGPVKMLLDQGIRIHGTTKDSSIGRAASHGCFRMHNKDAEDLAWFIQKNVSDKTEDRYRENYSKNRYRTHVVKLLQPVTVDIVYEPVEIANNTLYIHPDLYGWGGNKRDKILTLASAHGIESDSIDPTFWQRIKIGGKKGSQKIPLKELVAPPHENRHLNKD